MAAVPAGETAAITICLEAACAPAPVDPLKEVVNQLRMEVGKPFRKSDLEGRLQVVNQLAARGLDLIKQGTR